MKKFLKIIGLAALGSLACIGYVQATSCLIGQQGGTGICSATSSQTGYVPAVSATNPLTYTLVPQSGGGFTTPIPNDQGFGIGTATPTQFMYDTSGAPNNGSALVLYYAPTSTGLNGLFCFPTSSAETGILGLAAGAFGFNSSTTDFLCATPDFYIDGMGQPHGNLFGFHGTDNSTQILSLQPIILTQNTTANNNFTVNGNTSLNNGVQFQQGASTGTYWQSTDGNGDGGWRSLSLSNQTFTSSTFSATSTFTGPSYYAPGSANNAYNGGDSHLGMTNNNFYLYNPNNTEEYAGRDANNNVISYLYQELVNTSTIRQTTPISQPSPNFDWTDGNTDQDILNFNSSTFTYFVGGVPVFTLATTTNNTVVSTTKNGMTFADHGGIALTVTANGTNGQIQSNGAIGQLDFLDGSSTQFLSLERGTYNGATSSEFVTPYGGYEFGKLFSNDLMDLVTTPSSSNFGAIQNVREIDGPNGQLGLVGDIGINTTSPQQALDVYGNEDLQSTGYLMFDGANDMQYRMGMNLGTFTHSLTSGTSSIDIQIDKKNNSSFAIGTQGFGTSFETNRTSTFIQGPLGIGLVTSSTLTVAGDINFSGALSPSGLPGATGTILMSRGTGLSPLWVSTSTFALLGANQTFTGLNTFSATTTFATTTMASSTITQLNSSSVTSTNIVATTNLADSANPITGALWYTGDTKGDVAMTQNLATWNGNSLAVQNTNHRATVTIGTANSSTIPLYVNGATSQGVNLVTVVPTDNSSTVYFSVSATGTTAMQTSTVAKTLNANGEVNLNWGSPTTTACGTAPSNVGSNQAGTITVGTGISVTSCTLNFSPNFATTPSCVESDNSLAATGDVSAVSTSSVTFGLSASLAGGTIYYHCF